MKYIVINQDVLDWAERYDGEPFMACLCDPPYSYNFMSKDWDNAVAMQSATWAAIAQHLHPGAFLMAFSGSRTWHRLAVAIEDAGLRIHPSIFVWANGAGFPKATRIKDCKCKWQDEESCPKCERWQVQSMKGHRYGLQATKPAAEPVICAQVPYQGKPVESITSTGAGALNIDQSRIGTDDTRAAAYRMTSKDIPGGGFGTGEMDYSRDGSVAGSASGRWPANFALSHAAGCRRVGTKRVPASRQGAQRGNADFRGGERNDIERNEYPFADADGLETVVEWECVDGWRVMPAPPCCPFCSTEADSNFTPPDPAGEIVDYAGWEIKCRQCGERFTIDNAREICPVRRLGEQSGELSSGGFPARRGKQQSVYCGGLEGQESVRPAGTHRSNGSPSRFYHNADWQHEVAEQLAASDVVRYQAKSSRCERDAGLRGEKRFLATMGDGIGQREHNSDEPTAWVRNNHPCCKPIALTKWLATLLLPPAEYAPRRILVPFAGSGSEAIGALLAGWDEIVLVEMEQEYCAISEARLAWWAKQAAGTMFNDVKAILRNA